MESSTTEPQYEVRTCDKCGVEDSEPHHIVYTAAPGPNPFVSKHISCCAADGCEVCSAPTEEV